MGVLTLICRVLKKHDTLSIGAEIDSSAPSGLLQTTRQHIDGTNPLSSALFLTLTANPEFNPTHYYNDSNQKTYS